jgi:diacylglycerol kinase family enzyme
VVEVDLLVDDADGVVVNAVNVGIGADASRRGKGLKPWLGRAAYAIGALAAGIGSRGRRLHVDIDGRPLADGSRRVLQVGIGNGTYVGGGTALMPTARPSDGMVDVVISYAVGVRRFAYAFDVWRREHLGRTDVASARARSVRVYGEEFWCSADGELTGPHTDRTWSVRPGAVAIRLPRTVKAAPS